MSNLKAPRGCPDWLPEQCSLAEAIINKAKTWADIYGFSSYKTPMFESAQVFTKTLGDSSDIITKEMYSFTDRNNDLFILRPEATAPLVRLFISEKMQRSAPVKMFTTGPMFRYERPQKGRQRQFNQIGVEHIGAPNDLFTQFETLSMGWNFVNSLEIKAPLKIKVNGIGSAKDRKKFKEALIKYLTPLKDKLSEDSQKRLSENPLRILDSKSEGDKALLKKAPKISDFVNDESCGILKKLITLCESEGIRIEEDPLLVRGLDYYNDLVFEIIAEEELGAQNTILAGGRYDNLVASMGGGDYPAIGWGAGLERLMIISRLKVGKTPPIGLVVQSSSDELLGHISNDLRSKGLHTFIPRTGNFSKKILKCQKAGAKKIIIIGETEIKEGFWTIKDLEKGTQKSITRGQFLSEYSKQLFL